jgi:hypothetical protein
MALITMLSVVNNRTKPNAVLHYKRIHKKNIKAVMVWLIFSSGRNYGTGENGFVSLRKSFT